MRVSSDRRWGFDVEPDELWDAISTTQDYRRWWPWLRRFNAGGLVAGEVWTAVVQPPLPYSLTFTISLDDVVAPAAVSATIAGEIEGTAQLQIDSDGNGGCEARLASHLAPAHPILRAVAVFARPMVRFGHDWVLDTGARQFSRRALDGSRDPAVTTGVARPVDTGVPAVAWRGALLVAGTAVALLLAVAGRYGFHRDELYFVVAGKHLDWGYVDQPPFTPLIAHVASALDDGVAVLRVLPAIATAASVLLVALITREMGGNRRAQVLAAVSVAGGFALGVGHLLSTATFDLTAWLAVLLIAARLLRTDEPRWWLAFGAVCGLALLNKHLIVQAAVAVVAGCAIDRRWRLLLSWELVAGGLIALVLASPNLVWQATNGWPQLEMAEALENRIGGENRALLVPGQVVLLGPALAPLLVAGIRRLASDASARVHRPLLWAWLVALVLTFVAGGRPYYPLPFAMVVLAAGIVRWEAARWRTAVGLVAVNAVITLPIALPLLPLDTFADLPLAEVNEAAVETVGWPDLVRTVDGVLDDLPEGEREHAIVLALSYGEAGAIEVLGRDAGIPLPYSGHNHYWYWRQPPDDATTVIAVRYPAKRLAPFFDRCVRTTTISNGHGIENEVLGTPVHVCHGLQGTWDEVWPRLQHFS